jgi:hypothetical protein
MTSDSLAVRVGTQPRIGANGSPASLTGPSALRALAAAQRERQLDKCRAKEWLQRT